MCDSKGVYLKKFRTQIAGRGVIHAKKEVTRTVIRTATVSEAIISKVSNINGHGRKVYVKKGIT